MLHFFAPAAAASAFLASAMILSVKLCIDVESAVLLTCSLLGLHDGGDVLLVGSLLGASLGILVLLSRELARSTQICRLYCATYDVAQLLLGCLTGVLTLVTTGHLGLKGLENC